MSSPPSSSRKSWIAGAIEGLTGASDHDKTGEAKKEAEKITRSSDIRRLLEAGTNKETLENLYSKEEVEKVMQDIESEKALLELADQGIGEPAKRPHKEEPSESEQEKSENKEASETKEGTEE